MSDIELTIEEVGNDINLDISETGNDINLEISDGFSSFTSLTDTPNSYSGQALKGIRVNAAEDALEFFTGSGLVDWGEIGGTLSNQTDLQDALNLKYDSADYNSDWDTRLATKDTDDLTEGSTNLYDKTVVLNNGVGIEVTGTYPNFTITNTGEAMSLVGGNAIDITESPDDTFTIAVDESEISHTNISDIGTNTHAQIDTFINTTVPGTYVPYTGATSNVDLGEGNYLTAQGLYAYDSDAITTIKSKTNLQTGYAEITTTANDSETQGVGTIAYGSSYPGTVMGQNKAGLNRFYTYGGDFVFGTSGNYDLFFGTNDNLAATINTSQVMSFENFPISPSSAPTTDYQFANKKYVDDNIPETYWDRTGTTLSPKTSGDDIDDIGNVDIAGKFDNEMPTNNLIGFENTGEYTKYQSSYEENTLGVFNQEYTIDYEIGEATNFNGQMINNELNIEPFTTGLYYASRELKGVNNKISPNYKNSDVQMLSENFIATNNEIQASNNYTERIYGGEGGGYSLFHTANRNKLQVGHTIDLDDDSFYTYNGIGNDIDININSIRMATGTDNIAVEGNIYGNKINVVGWDDTITDYPDAIVKTYGSYVKVTGALGSEDSIWSYYVASTQGNNFLGGDDVKTYFGTAKDASIYYDGSDFLLDCGIVGASDFIVDCGTEKTLELAETVWNDYTSPIISTKPGTNSPTFTTFLGNLKQYTFGINDEVHGTIEILHGYKEGTDFDIHIHWATNGSDGTDRKVKWELEYTIQNSEDGVDGVFPTPTVVSGETTIDANTTSKSHVYTEIAEIDGTDIKIGAILCYRLRRISSTGTEPSNDPFGLQLGMHYQINTIGSRQELVK